MVNLRSPSPLWCADLSYLQVAGFLGELFNEMVWPDVVRYLTGWFGHLERQWGTGEGQVGDRTSG